MPRLDACEVLDIHAALLPLAHLRTAPRAERRSTRSSANWARRTSSVGTSSAASTLSARSRSRISSLYTSSIDTVKTKPPFAGRLDSALASAASDERASEKSSASARKLTPRSSGGPSIVCVLPEPVCPYAKMHTRWPSSALAHAGATWSRRVSRAHA